MQMTGRVITLLGRIWRGLAGEAGGSIQWDLMRNRALVSACFFALPACSATPVAESWAQELGVGDVVAVVPIEAGFGLNDHPAQIPSARLQQWLGELTMTVPATEDLPFAGAPPRLKSVFTGDEAAMIARALAEALASATPDQDVAVRVEQQRADRYVGVKNPDVTALRSYVRDDQLHLIFGVLALDPLAEGPDQLAPLPLEEPSRRMNRTADFQAEIGSRNGPGVGPATLVMPAYGKAGKTGRADWLVIATGAPVATASQPAAVTDLATEPGQSKPEPVGAGAADTHTPLAAQLQELKALREQGLIDEALYRAKTRELVDRYFGDQPGQR